MGFNSYNLYGLLHLLLNKTFLAAGLSAAHFHAD